VAASPVGTVPVAVHIGAGEVAETVEVVVMDTDIVARPPGMFLVVALAANTPDSLVDRVEVAGRVDMSAVVAGC
jgi:hypothetical protein